jgi:thiamine-phosphate pyrophosphorylase
MAAATAGSTPVCQLYVMLEAGPTTADLLAALLAAVPIPSVLIAAPRGVALTAPLVRPIIEMAQKRHCAALLLDDAQLARVLRADGVHLSAGADLVARYDEARSILGAGAIVGVDAGGSRHEAMELGEAGADYVAFSADADAVPPTMVAPEADASADPAAEDADYGPQTLHDLIGWWSEVFEVPCVAFGAADLDGARGLAEAGAEFVVCRVQAGRVIGDCIKDVVSWRDAVEARS